jgi:hypothetical protein
MVEAENVSVCVIRYNDGVPYTEYAPPTTSTGHGTSPNERYIEVSTDERYYIEVKLLRGFKFASTTPWTKLFIAVFFRGVGRRTQIDHTGGTVKMKLILSIG